MRSHNTWSRPLERLRRGWHPNRLFIRNTRSLLVHLAMFCWICGAAGNLLRTYTVAHFDWLNLSLAFTWALLSLLAVAWIALFRWELTYVTRYFPRPLGIALLAGCELLCGWLGWRSPPSFTPLPLVISIPFALIGAAVDCYVLAAFLCIAWDRLQGPRSWRFEQNRMDEGWKTFFHPSPFLRWYYALLHQWHDLRQMVRADAERGRPMNEREFLQERIRRLALLEEREQQRRK
jgi:hypothetical protein